MARPGLPRARLRFCHSFLAAFSAVSSLSLYEHYGAPFAAVSSEWPSALRPRPLLSSSAAPLASTMRAAVCLLLALAGVCVLRAEASKRGLDAPNRQPANPDDVLYIDLEKGGRVVIQVGA